MLLDTYFKRPLLFDFIISISLVGILYFGVIKWCIELPKPDRLNTIASDLAAISFTAAGFILTFLTLLISFKSSSKITKEDYSEDEPLFNLFFASDLYFITVRILKNCIKSLIITASVGYFLQLILPLYLVEYVFFYNVFALTIIVLTLFRCLLILNKILQMQEN